MESNFIGNTMIYVDKPYKLWDYGYSFYNLDNLISDTKINALIQRYFYDGSTSHKGLSPFYFAKNVLESVDEQIIDKWAEFSERSAELLEDYLMKRVNPFDTENLSDLYGKIPFDTSPIISLSEDSLANIQYGVGNDAKYFRFPDEGIGIFTEIAKIELFNNNSLRKFSNIFGLPLGVNLFDGTNNPDINDTMQYNTLLYFGAAPIAVIYMELTEYRNIFNSFIAVKTNDPRLAKKINLKKDLIEQVGNVSVFSKDRKETIKDLKEKYRNELEIQRGNDEFEIMKCRKYLVNTLNKKANVNSKIVDTLNGDFLETKLFNDLFEISYNQIKKSLINKSEIKKCDYCGYHFEPQHGKQRFCSPLPFRKRSSCENNYNQAKAKSKK